MAGDSAEARDLVLTSEYVPISAYALLFVVSGWRLWVHRQVGWHEGFGQVLRKRSNLLFTLSSPRSLARLSAGAAQASPSAPRPSFGFTSSSSCLRRRKCSRPRSHYRRCRPQSSSQSSHLTSFRAARTSHFCSSSKCTGARSSSRSRPCAPSGRRGASSGRSTSSSTSSSLLLRSQRCVLLPQMCITIT